MSKFRFTLLGLAVLLTAVFVGAALGFAPKGERSDTYAVSGAPGTYGVTLERFKRHGPEVIERTPFQLESSTQVIRYRIKDDGSVVGLSHSVTSNDGENRYLLELEGNQWTVTDLTTGTQSEGPTVPESSIPVGELSREAAMDLVGVLERAGMTRVSESVWRERNVAIYEAVGPIVGQLSRPELNGPIGFPVVYDLAPVSQRAGVYLDIATGIAIRTYRYAIDSFGDETLIESLEVLSIARED